MPSNRLSAYQEKRDFGITAEPRGKVPRQSAKKLQFVIQLHEARRTHYDFRLEWGGVMKSWAVTKGPSYDPADKRLAVRTEDHPIEYNRFEGVIPDKQYGAGPVMIWDQGLWVPDDDPDKMEKKGHIAFTIAGSRMKGHWHLVRMRTQEKRENWLLIKGDDEFVLNKTKNAAFLKKENTSVISGRTMAEIRQDGPGKTTAKKASAKKAAHKKTAKTARKPTASFTALLKKYSKPELATLVENAPSGAEWIHEIKYDGYRLMAFIRDGRVLLQTRGGKDWTHKFTPLARALAALDVGSAVLDLEACVQDANGRTSFSALQEALSDENPDPIEGWIFDLLMLNGQDYTARALLERKAALAKILKKAKAPLHYSDHFESAPGLLSKACKVGAEGLISKKKDSLYRGRRTAEWVKSKCGLEQEFVIGGFMPAKDHNKAVGALLLGYYKNKKFTYAGKVGTGFTRKLAQDLYRKLIPLRTDQSPFPEKPPRGLRAYVYVAPEILCEVAFAQWTADGHIRHGSFKGVREDKNPRSVTEETPKTLKAANKSAPRKTKSGSVSFEGVSITHPEREVYPGTGITKGDVAAYYAKMAPAMLPYLQGRLISLLRCTDGIEGDCFFQRNPMKGMGDRVKSKTVTHKGKKHTYLYIEDATGLMQLVQMGTMEFHAWQSRVTDIGKPDQVIFDLDPDKDVPFEAVKLAARDVQARLKKIGLESYPRVSGGKGIHVVVAIKPEHGWDDIKEFARRFAEGMAKDAPAAYVANMSKKKRTGKIFIDFFRNDFSSTAIVPYSLRARDNAPVAVPLSWAELDKIKAASQFTMAAVLKRRPKAEKMKPQKLTKTMLQKGAAS